MTQARSLAWLSAALTTSLLVSTLSLSLSSCAPPAKPRNPGVLIVSKEQAASWTRNFNVLSPLAAPRWPTMAGIYEPLAVWNSVQGVYAPWLATSWAFSEDSLTATVTLREGVRWSDGRPFVAEDVAFTFTLLKPLPSTSAACGRSSKTCALFRSTAQHAAPRR